MNKLGELIRVHREANKMYLRHLAAQLDIDTAQLSKIERGVKFAKQKHILQLANIFNLDQDELFSLWLADQVFQVVENREQAKNALHIVLKELN